MTVFRWLFLRWCGVRYLFIFYFLFFWVLRCSEPLYVPLSKFNVYKVMKQLQFELNNRFTCLSREDKTQWSSSEDEDWVAHDNEVEKKWKMIRQTYCNMARFVLSYWTRKIWIRPESSKRLEERRGLKQKLVGVRSTRFRASLLEE